MGKHIKVAELPALEEADYVYSVEVDGFQYEVSFSNEYCQKLTSGKITPEELVRKSFEFLLEREGPESILRRFSLPIISQYFPEYETAISGK